jgi:AraC-like DNA-binding protein
MSTWSLIDTINGISVFFLCFFSLFLFSHKRGKPSSNRTLAFFLLTMALSTLNFPLSHDKRLVAYFLPIFLFINSFDFLLGPLLYLYVKSVAYRDFAWERNQALHAMPFFIYLLFFIINLLVVPSSFQDIMLYRKSFFRSFGMDFFTILISGQLLAYVGASFLVLRSYRARIKSSFSSLEKINLSWLYSIIGGCGLIWLISAVNNMQAIGMRGGRHSLVLSVTNMFITFGIANVIIFKGLKQPEIFSGIEEKPKYEKSPLTDEEANRLLDLLKNHLETQKPHLVPGLSISGLARQMAVPARNLSQVINSRMGQNFVDFINSYRIEEAKRLLSGSGACEKTILEIAYDSGFNSKSVFNKAFKKHAGIPPVEFRRKAGKE